MTDGGPAEPPVASWPRPVIVPRWRWRVWVHPSTWIRALLTAVLIAGAMIAGGTIVLLIATLLEDRMRASNPGGYWAVVVLVGGAAVVAVALAARELSRRLGRRAAAVFAHSIPRLEPARSFMLAELSEGGPPKQDWGTWRSRRWVEQVRDGSDARAFVGHALAERVTRYDRTDRPVEPERIGGAMGVRSFSNMVIGAVFTASFAWLGGPTSIAAIIAAAITVGSAIQAIRRRSLFAPVIAGQGWVQHGSVRWTVEDSILVASGLVNARVAIAGPQGVLELRLRSARQADLEQLWMRWMHPLPNLAQQAFDA